MNHGQLILYLKQIGYKYRLLLVKAREDKNTRLMIAAYMSVPFLFHLYSYCLVCLLVAPCLPFMQQIHAKFIIGTREGTTFMVLFQ